jgi:3-isopropylmalate dehydrogenase
MIGSLAMALRYSFGLGDAADRIERAIGHALGQGLRTPDIKGDAAETVSTAAMGDAIAAALETAAS